RQRVSRDTPCMRLPVDHRPLLKPVALSGNRQVLQVQDELYGLSRFPVTLSNRQQRRKPTLAGVPFAGSVKSGLEMHQGRGLARPARRGDHERRGMDQGRRNALVYLRPEHVSVPDLLKPETADIPIRPDKRVQVSPTRQQINRLSGPPENEFQSLITRRHGLTRVSKSVLSVVELRPENVSSALLLQNLEQFISNSEFSIGHAGNCDSHSTTPLLFPVVLFPTTRPRPVFFLGLAVTNPYKARVTATTGVISDSLSFRPQAHVSPRGRCLAASTADERIG